MPKNKKNRACESLAGSKTTILVLEKERLTSSKLSEVLKASDLDSSIKIHSNQGAKYIKCYDIYVIERQDVSIQNKIQLVKKIYRANPKACVFLLGEDEETKTIIAKEIRPYLDPIKLGVVFESSISKNDEELNNVVEYISSVEDTKKRLICLWQKLEVA